MELFKDVFSSDALTYEEFSDRLSEAGMDLSELAAKKDASDKRETELLEKLHDLETKHETELKTARAEGLLMAELIRQGALNPSLAAKVIDLDGLETAEDLQSEISGRVSSLRQSEPYLFISYKDAGATGLRHGTTHTDTDSMSDFDYYSKYRFKNSV